MNRFILSALLASSLAATAAEKVFLIEPSADSRVNLRSLGPVEGARELAVPDSGGHLLVLTNRGNVLAWGDNRAGQLGVGNTEARSGFVEVHGLGQASAIAAGAGFSAALRTDGTVWTWGWGRATAEPAAGLWDILRIAAGDDFLLAVRSDGTLWTLSKQGQPEQVDGVWDVTAAAALGSKRYARDATGRIWTWKPEEAPRLADRAEALAAQARFAGVTNEWLGSPLRVEENGLRLGAALHPFSGNVMDIEAGWSVALIAADAAASIAAATPRATGSGSSTAAKQAAVLTAGLTGARFASSSPLITAAETHSLYLAGGKVCAFGVNDFGELGDGTAVKRATPVPAAHMSSLSIVSTGFRHSIALKSDGTVYTWGYNAYGELGDGTTNTRPTPFVIAGLTGIAAVSAGSYHSLVLKNDGTVWAFGYNGYGELGDGTTTNRATAVQVIGLTGVTAISAGQYYSVALKSDGTVWAWGINSWGNLGDGTTTSRTSPVQVAGMSGVTAIAASYYHTLMLKGDGTLWGVGYNGYGGLGDGSTTYRPNAVRAGTLTGITSIGTGEYHSLAVKSDGTVWAFGLNNQGQLGDGTIANKTSPVQVSGFTNAARVVGGSLHSIAAKTDGSIWAWGDNANNQLGNGNTTDSTVPTATSACGSDPTPPGPTPSNASRALSAEETHSLALRSDGTGAGWGLNTNGELGDGTSTNRNVPSQTSGLTGALGISAGLLHGAAVLSNGLVRTWGYNAYGELGDGSNTSKTSPVTVSGLSGAIAVSAGAYHTLALKSDGTVWAFGYNGYGELGDGSTTNRNVPVQVVGLTNVTAISAGRYYSVALKSDGTVWAWGINSWGNLGDGSFTSRSNAVKAAQLEGAVAIAAGDYHTLILKNDGTVWAMGYNAYGELGDGSNDYRPNIVRASGLTNVIAIAAGEYHSVVVKSDGTVWTFGRNNVGQLGDGSVVTRLVPVQTAGGLTGVIAVAAGSVHSLAMKSDGKIFVWGSNAQGQFGITTPASSTVPIEGPASFGPPTPVPVITSLTPGSVTAGAAAFNLDVTGVNFTNQSVVRWNGVARSTTYLNATTLRAQISAADVLSSAVVPITVFDPVNGTSAAVNFTINPDTGVGKPSNPNPATNTTGLATTTSVSWAAAANATSYDVYFGTTAAPTFVANVSGTAYNPGPLQLATTYFWRIVARNGVNTNSGDLWQFTTFNPNGGLRFVPVVPCRLADTRTGSGFTGNFGAPTLNAGVTREMTIPAGPCGIPASAKAFSFNVTVVPAEPLSYLTMWPTGQVQPLVSTLNSFHGGIVANAAIVPAGTNGAVSIFVTNRTDVILDINGYFDDNLAVTSYSFYSVDPCRVADTRTGSGFSGLYGAPTPAANETRSFPLAGRCTLPAAAAYSLNVTVVPPAPLSFLTIFPTGSARPLVSTLNSFDGAIVANAAIVPAGANGAVSTFVTHVADQILDVNGYFGTPGGANELRFQPITPCRVADTRIAGQGAPIMNAASQKDFPVVGVCGVPSDAKAYSFNVTVVPTGGLSFLTLWPAGKARPLVSTLNSFLGRVVANAAIAPAGTNGNVSVFVTDQTHVILDINGYFR